MRRLNGIPPKKYFQGHVSTAIAPSYLNNLHDLLFLTACGFLPKLKDVQFSACEKIRKPVPLYTFRLIWCCGKQFKRETTEFFFQNYFIGQIYTVVWRFILVHASFWSGSANKVEFFALQ